MMESNKGGGIIVAKQRMRIEIPFTFKVLQVFTGFGVGCGIGIGAGTPLQLGAIPVLNQVMAATRGAADAFSGVRTHVNHSLRKLGVKKIEVGIGCGVGFGHGFGVGLAVKPGVVHQLQSYLVQAMTMVMKKFGMTPDLSNALGNFPGLMPGSMTKVNDPTSQSPMGNIMQLAGKVPDHSSQPLPKHVTSETFPALETSVSNSTEVSTPYGSRTEKVISTFLQSSRLKDEDSELNEMAARLKAEKTMLQMVLKHQQVIEELMEENQKLRRILVEDLKVHPSKLKVSYSSRDTSPCTECFECRRKQKKNR